MKRNIPWASYTLAFVLALGFGSVVGAIQEKTTNGKAVSVTGCLQKGDKAGEYSILPPKTVVGLGKHVGHKVTVTGTQVREENEEKEKKEAGGGEYADLRVTSLKMISEGCSK